MSDELFDAIKLELSEDDARAIYEALYQARLKLGIYKDPGPFSERLYAVEERLDKAVIAAGQGARFGLGKTAAPRSWPLDKITEDAECPEE